VEELDNILLPEVFRKLCVVFPLYKARLAINVLFQLLHVVTAEISAYHRYFGICKPEAIGSTKRKYEGNCRHT
jgi:hypothetical protein